ncbi:MAG: (Fe-S)-binding protein [Gammaproteobacteria bacterium]
MPKQRRYPEKPASVYFYGTCLVDLFYPDAGMAGMELLQRAGVEVIFPPDQTCCGQPAFNSGYRDEALAVARRQLACFPRPIPVVVPSASCAGMMRHHYPDLFAGEADLPQAQAIAERTFELTEFLVHVLDLRLEDRGEPIRVALHTSCSAWREMGVAEEHRRLLAQLESVELVEPERNRECCGFGGTFAVKHPEISAAMVTDKTAEIRATGAERVVSGDCGCLMNIAGALEHQGSPIRGQHIASFLLERTR